MKQILVSAGDALTAKLVEQAGFDGVWVSGFEASARLGLQDNGSITMSEMLNIAKPIVDAVSIPVYVDVDTGYGNFQRTVREFEDIRVAGICVEDNLHNKQNSLWGDKVPLMGREDFIEKLKSVKERQIALIARTEALIRGYGMDEANKRADAYSDYSDLILIHTRDSSGKEARKIPNSNGLFGDGKYRKPLAIVPTKFPEYTNQQLFDMGYSMVIWANQTERVKIKAIRDGLKIMKTDDCASLIERELSATLDDMKGLTC